MFTIVIVSVLLACACGAPAGPPPHHGSGYHEPHYEPRPYAYEYGVKDDYHGVHFGQNEESDGKVVHGSYHVLLPDGRVQTVKYTADHYNGYVADVGYDAPHTPYHAPKPHHKPAPYHPPPPPAYHPDPHHF
jgi:hypothetical protein